MLNFYLARLCYILGAFSLGSAFVYPTLNSALKALDISHQTNITMIVGTGIFCLIAGIANDVMHYKRTH